VPGHVSLFSADIRDADETCTANLYRWKKNAFRMEKPPFRALSRIDPDAETWYIVSRSRTPVLFLA
jgi:hypothetical protein